ncbi:MAG: hypothetical protein V1799_07605 [bacterium]
MVTVEVDFIEDRTHRNRVVRIEMESFNESLIPIELKKNKYKVLVVKKSKIIEPKRPTI